jgi:peptidoglycan-associated lipoprotein
MFLRSLLKITIACVVGFTLAACSTTKTTKASTDSSYAGGNSGTSAMGLGDEGQSIGGFGTSEAYRLRGGANQIYFFEYDQSTVNDKYVPSINAQANYILSHSSAHLLLTGNTDERGSREYNIALGNRRALAVANVLKAQGVAPGKFRVVSYGSEKPVAQGHDDHAWALNRNVQLIFEAK